MSHYPVLVLHRADQSVDDLLDPFSISEEVPTHRRRCDCIETAARGRAWAEAEAEIGATIDQISRRFTDAHAEERDRLLDRQTWDPALARRLYSEWQALVDPWRRAYEAALAAARPHTVPDPECEFCEGTGSYDTDENPFGRLDWYQVGGRCSGALDGYDPEQDPSNREACPLCKGSGRSSDTEAPGDCPQCQGEGTVPKWPTEWKPHPGDTCPVSRVPVDYVPYAVVTPEREWHEIEEAGWLGLPLDEDWIRQVRALLERHGECPATIVDVHR